MMDSGLVAQKNRQEPKPVIYHGDKRTSHLLKTIVCDPELEPPTTTIGSKIIFLLGHGNEGGYPTICHCHPQSPHARLNIMFKTHHEDTTIYLICTVYIYIYT